MLFRPPFFLIAPQRAWYLVFSSIGAVLLFTLYRISTSDEPSLFSQSALFLSISFGAYALVNLVRASIVSTYRAKRNYSNEYSDNFTLGTQVVSVIAVSLISIAAFFSVFGIQFDEFITSIALFGVALAIIFKEYLQNLIHSLYVLFSSYYTLGRWLYVEEGPIGQIRWFNFQHVVMVGPMGGQFRMSYIKLLEHPYAVLDPKIVWFSSHQVERAQVAGILEKQSLMQNNIAELGIDHGEVLIKIRKFAEFSAIVTIELRSDKYLPVKEYSHISEMVNEVLAKHVSEK